MTDGQRLRTGRQTGKPGEDNGRKPHLMDYDVPVPRVPVEPPCPFDPVPVALLIPEPRRSPENRMD